MTVGARLYRVEQQLSVMDKKIDQVLHALNTLAHKSYAPPSTSSSSIQPVIASTSHPQLPAPASTSQQHHQHHPPMMGAQVPLASIEDDV